MKQSNALEISPRSPFSTTPLQRTPANICIKLTLLETTIPGLHFCCCLYGSIFIQILMVGSETHVCNATECIIAVQGHFRVNQGRRFWYQSKARFRFPIYIVTFVVSRTVSEIWRLIGRKLPIRTHPTLIQCPRSG